MRKSLPKTGHELQAVNSTIHIDTAFYGDTVRGILLRIYAPLKGGEKLLARDANVSPGTVRNWLRGLSSPRGAELLRLMAGCEAVKIELFRLVEESSAATQRATDAKRERFAEMQKGRG